MCISLLRLSAMIAFLAIYTVAPIANALSSKQVQLYQRGVLYFDDAISCVGGDTSGQPAGTAPSTTDLKSFVDAYAQSAFNVGKKFGIPYEAILAQGALESGMGKSQLTVQAFNFFGIKAGTGWSGPVVYFNTQEQHPDGSVYVVKAAFRAYANAEAGFTGYGEFITSNPRYAPALKYPTNYVEYIKAIKAAGYATDVQYVNKVTSIANAVADYIKKQGILPPSSSLTPSAAPPQTNTGQTSTPDSSSCDSSSTGGGSGNGGVVSVAKTELAKSPVEYDSNVLKYTDGIREAWCADFVSWVYKTAGKPFTDGSSGGWRQASVVNLQAWFQKNQTYFAVGSQPPQPGDVAFYIGSQTPDGGSAQHVNIVISVQGDTMVTIGGNESNKVVQSTRKIALGQNSLVGFGRLK
jgi:hypothetical protein